MAEQTYTVVRRWADGKWHIEAQGITLRKAHNLQGRLLRSIRATTDADVKVIRGGGIFDWLKEAIDNAPV